MEDFINPFLNESHALTFRLKRALPANCNAAAIDPIHFQTMSRYEIGQVKLLCENREMRIDEFFEINGDPSQHLIIDGDCAHLDDLGYGMRGGTILVRGSIGHGVASHMRAGTIEIRGDCGDRLASSMRNGLVFIHGSAGDSIAGPSPGLRQGMRGGDCIVLGNVGSRAAERMRRGTLLIGGNAGDYGAPQMIAGTFIVMGQIGTQWAEGMKRGSIILMRAAENSFAAELTPAREFELSFLPLLWRHLQKLLGNARVKLPQSRWAMRRVGDRANMGVGEVLTLTRDSST